MDSNPRKNGQDDWDPLGIGVRKLRRGLVRDTARHNHHFGVCLERLELDC